MGVSVCFSHDNLIGYHSNIVMICQYSYTIMTNNLLNLATTLLFIKLSSVASISKHIKRHTITVISFVASLAAAAVLIHVIITRAIDTGIVAAFVYFIWWRRLNKKYIY